MSRRLGTFIVGIAMALTGPGGCRSTGSQSDISFVDREAASGVGDPLTLVVSIDAGGKLTLNQIETGTISDTAILNEKLRTIFEDRRRRSISENEVLIEMVGTIAYEDMDSLITSLRPLQPSRITVISR